MNIPTLTNTSYIFKGIDHNSGGLSQNTEYEFRVFAKVPDYGRPNAQPQRIISPTHTILQSDPFTTTTLPPLTFAPAEVLWIQGNGIEGIKMRPTNFHDVDFRVFNSGYIRLGDARWGSGDNKETNTERYEFKFTVPSATGFQRTRVLKGPTGIVVKNHAVCDWETWPSESSDWMKWRPHVKLVRCGIGDGTSWITIKVRNTEHANYEWDARTVISVKQAQHHADHNLDYQTVCLPPPTDDLDYAAAVDTGASYWNDSNKYGVSFTKQPQIGCTDVVERYRRVTVEIYSHKDDNKCKPNKAAACLALTLVGRDRIHLISQSLFINGDIKWDSDEDGDGQIADDATYLPDTVAHEFGHAAGLAHPFRRNLIASTGAKKSDVQGSLTAIDELAIKSIYKTHVKH